MKELVLNGKFFREVYFDVYRIKFEEWYIGIWINIKLILMILYNNDDVDMDLSMGLVLNI